MAPDCFATDSAVSSDRSPSFAEPGTDARWVHLAERAMAGYRGPGTLCLSLPAPGLRAAGLFASEPTPSAFLWIDDNGSATAGLDITYEVQSSGADRFSDLARSAQTIYRQIDSLSVAGAPPRSPRFFGGLAFADGKRDRSWKIFGDARFVLPRWQIDEIGCEPTLTLAVTADELTSRSQRHRWLQALETKLALWSHETEEQSPSRRSEVTRPSPEAWENTVRAARQAILRGQFRKLVAAQIFDVDLERPLQPSALAASIPTAGEGVTGFAFRFGDATFFGATPETLVKRLGRRMWSEALAGTAPSEISPSQFLASSKDRHEHRLVVDEVTRQLAPLCSELAWSPVPRVRALGHLQHLHTPICGRLANDLHLLELASILHPTPAVGGLPSADAVAWIAAHEPFDRGWYGGPVGWFDGRGDGELRVALRCALADGTRIRVPAGAGLVAGSRAAAEYRETELKAKTMIHRLLDPRNLTRCDQTSPAAGNDFANQRAPALAVA